MPRFYRIPNSPNEGGSGIRQIRCSLCQGWLPKMSLGIRKGKN
ncbi:hypothetical protein HOLDEFILI_00933 [Holdemania filiformis DSM 12042]|uniref:Uncharacterized protein n=1 Tax=Holdemania filiformis DSM 12042 TaxID=545696 RepID=B9Y552_9FIRM|nr:hypothetical protein HOLDEFILI_00933 [Holdemania filiformis DSM 12042]